MIVEKFSKGMLRRNLGNSYQGLPDIELRQILEEYRVAKTVYRNNLFSNLEALSKKQLTREEFLVLQRETIKQAYLTSYTLGKRMSNLNQGVLSDTEMRSIVIQVDKELAFMSGFADSVVSGNSNMDYSQRMDMYVDSLDAVFGFGKLVYMPEDMKIFWRLGMTDKHCQDCLSYASNNPYTKRSLPGYPKSGSSRCLSNCRCRLDYYDKTGTIKYEKTSPEINSGYVPFILSLGKIPSGKFIPTVEEFLEIETMVESYYYHRLLSDIDKSHFKKSQDILQGITAYTLKRNLYFPISFQIYDVLAEFKQFKNHNNFEITLDFLLLRRNDMVYVFRGRHGVYGKVTATRGLNVTVVTVEKETRNLVTGKDLVFKYEG